MKISALKTLAVSILVSGIVALGFAAPAQASAAANISSSTIALSTGTPAGFTAELAATTYHADTYTIDVGPSSSSGWTNMASCKDFAHKVDGNSSDCGVQSVEVVHLGTPTAVTGWTAFKTSGGQIRMNRVGGMTFVNNDTILITFSAGAFISPASNTTSQFEFKTLHTGGVTVDSAWAIFTVGTGSSSSSGGGSVGGGSVGGGGLSFPVVSTALGSACYNDVSIVPSSGAPSGGFYAFASDAPAGYFPAGLSLTRAGRLQGTLSSSLTYDSGQAYKRVLVQYFPAGTTSLLTANISGTVDLHLTNSSSCAASPTVSSSAAALTINASTGSAIAGSTVAIQASGLQSTASYTVTVQSTPQVIGSGNAVAGVVNSSVTIPAGLEAGWHTLTFTSTAADGSSVVSKVYFEVSATGTLVSSTTTIPAALANTGTDSKSGVYLGLGFVLAGLIALAGIQVARRRNS